MEGALLLIPLTDLRDPFRHFWAVVSGKARNLSSPPFVGHTPAQKKNAYLHLLGRVNAGFLPGLSDRICGSNSPILDRVGMLSEEMSVLSAATFVVHVLAPEWIVVRHAKTIAADGL